MRLTTYTDYSLRVLIFVGLKGNDLSTISEISERYNISRNHLMKVVNQLSQDGYLKTIRGKNGGMLLARSPDSIGLGDVVRDMEDNLEIVECFDKKKGCCQIDGYCQLQGILGEAIVAFFEVLDRYTLKDLMHNKQDLQRALSLF
ncbi:Rrf2 family transcriptional regulator [Kiloniella laminariae]|uniref:Rrf2 family transcriptional regulator n=1 Tax=Kiloniella laminariae TaxID=454162 RepID=A0ABT4LNS3_9PROT|nr:Rrf2 family transcriptional regulator [Kiloniella laminariae]MCZ4282788.1 Rrf2 family transcriptional regulator [Kiloniella laminariae]